jgi:hypothetical protein
VAQAVYGLRFITLLSALQNPAQYTRQNVLGLLAAYFPRPGTAGWPAAWQRYAKAFHLDGATESPELADFRRTVVKSVLRADRYFSARLTVGAEAHRGKDRTQAVLGKDLVMFLSVYRISVWASWICDYFGRIWILPSTSKKVRKTLIYTYTIL